jgi:hypothetical protein
VVKQPKKEDKKSFGDKIKDAVEFQSNALSIMKYDEQLL